MPMTKFDITEISICSDCAMMVAHGELGRGDEAAEQAHSDTMVAVWGEGLSGVLGLVLGGGTGEETESYFSRSPCDGCHSSLGGDRFDAVHMVEVEVS